MESFDLDELDELKAHLHAKILKGARAGMLSAAIRMVQQIKGEIIPHEDPKPVDIGTYSAAWNFVETDKGADVFNNAPHASVIEFGARAENIKIGRAMIDALAEWAVWHGMLGKGKGSIQERAEGSEARSIAFAIAQNMKKRGIFNRGSEGLGIAKKAAKAARKWIMEEVAAEIEAAMKE